MMIWKMIFILDQSFVNLITLVLKKPFKEVSWCLSLINGKAAKKPVWHVFWRLEKIKHYVKAVINQARKIPYVICAHLALEHLYGLYRSNIIWHESWNSWLFLSLPLTYEKKKLDFIFNLVQKEIKEKKNVVKK